MHCNSFPAGCSFDPSRRIYRTYLGHRILIDKLISREATTVDRRKSQTRVSTTVSRAAAIAAHVR